MSTTDPKRLWAMSYHDFLLHSELSADDTGRTVVSITNASPTNAICVFYEIAGTTNERFVAIIGQKKVVCVLRSASKLAKRTRSANTARCNAAWRERFGEDVIVTSGASSNPLNYNGVWLESTRARELLGGVVKVPTTGSHAVCTLDEAIGAHMCSFIDALSTPLVPSPMSRMRLLLQPWQSATAHDRLVDALAEQVASTQQDVFKEQKSGRGDEDDATTLKKMTVQIRQLPSGLRFLSIDSLTFFNIPSVVALTVGESLASLRSGSATGTHTAGGANAKQLFVDFADRPSDDGFHVVDKANNGAARSARVFVAGTVGAQGAWATASFFKPLVDAFPALGDLLSRHAGSREQPMAHDWAATALKGLDHLAATLGKSVATVARLVDGAIFTNCDVSSVLVGRLDDEMLALRHEMLAMTPPATSAAPSAGKGSSGCKGVACFKCGSGIYIDWHTMALHLRSCLGEQQVDLREYRRLFQEKALTFIPPRSISPQQLSSVYEASDTSLSSQDRSRSEQLELDLPAWFTGTATLEIDPAPLPRVSLWPMVRNSTLAEHLVWYRRDGPRLAPTLPALATLSDIAQHDSADHERLAYVVGLLESALPIMLEADESIVLHENVLIDVFLDSTSLGVLLADCDLSWLMREAIGKALRVTPLNRRGVVDTGFNTGTVYGLRWRLIRGDDFGEVKLSTAATGDAPPMPLVPLPVVRVSPDPDDLVPDNDGVCSTIAEFGSASMARRISKAIDTAELWTREAFARLGIEIGDYSLPPAILSGSSAVDAPSWHTRPTVKTLRFDLVDTNTSRSDSVECVDLLALARSSDGTITTDKGERAVLALVLMGGDGLATDLPQIANLFSKWTHGMLLVMAASINDGFGVGTSSRGFASGRTMIPISISSLKKYVEGQMVPEVDKAWLEAFTRLAVLSTIQRHRLKRNTDNRRRQVEEGGETGKRLKRVR